MLRFLAVFAIILFLIPVGFHPASAQGTGQSFEWKAGNCLNYSVSIAINYTTEAATSSGYFHVSFRSVSYGNCNAYLEVDQSIAFKGANQVYCVSLSIGQIPVYIPYFPLANINDAASLDSILNLSYGSEQYYENTSIAQVHVLNSNTSAYRIAFNSTNTSGSVMVNELNGIVICGTVTSKLLDLNLQESVERAVFFNLDRSNIPMGVVSNPGGPLAAIEPYSPYTIYFYYSTLGAYAFLIGLSAIWLLRRMKS